MAADAQLDEAEQIAKARRIQVEAEAFATPVIVQAIAENGIEAAQYQVALKQVEALTALGNSEGNQTVILPANALDALADDFERTRIMAIIETWWAWVAFGIVLMLLELMMPSYLFLGFGFGAIVTGITLALGITMSAQYLMLLFAIASLISWVLLRQVFKFPKRNVKTFDHDINDN